MNKTESIATLAAALCKAQAVMEGAKKDSINPHFKSKYADLASVWDACRKPLSDNGLSIVQLPGKDETGYFLETILAHNSGEWVSSKLAFAPVKDDPQGLGSALTYARRYGLSAMVGIAPEEDDGEGAMGRTDARREEQAREAHTPREQARPIARRPDPRPPADDPIERDDLPFNYEANALVKNVQKAA